MVDQSESVLAIKKMKGGRTSRGVAVSSVWTLSAETWRYQSWPTRFRRLHQMDSTSCRTQRHSPSCCQWPRFDPAFASGQEEKEEEKEEKEEEEEAPVEEPNEPETPPPADPINEPNIQTIVCRVR